MTTKEKSPRSLLRGLTASLLFLALPAYADKASDVVAHAADMATRADEVSNLDTLDHLADSLTAKVHTAEAVQAAVDLHAAAAAERTCRAAPACMTKRIEQLQANIAEAHDFEAAARGCIERERSNPAGVISLVALHACGRDLQNAQQAIGIYEAKLARARRLSSPHR